MKNNKFVQPETQEEGNETSTIYGDIITFVMMLFILLFVLSYNEQNSETFFTEMRLKFGAKEVEQEEVLTTEEIFVSKLQGYLKQEQIEDKTKILIDEQRVKIILNPAVLFDSGKAQLKPRGKEVIHGLGKILGEVKNPIIIEGHTDNVPIHTKKFESNWELSFHRAYSVVKFLMASFKYTPKQLSAQGYGEHQPLETNDTAEGRAKNRRIEFNIVRVTEAESEAGGNF